MSPGQGQMGIQGKWVKDRWGFRVSGSRAGYILNNISITSVQGEVWIPKCFILFRNYDSCCARKQDPTISHFVNMGARTIHLKFWSQVLTTSQNICLNVKILGDMLLKKVNMTHKLIHERCWKNIK